MLESRHGEIKDIHNDCGARFPNLAPTLHGSTPDTTMDMGNRRKDEILATLSHELRNPLASLRSSLYVLQRAEPGSGQARRMMAIMDRQVDQLTSLTNDLLEAARIGHDKIALRRATIDLCALVRTSVEDNLALFAGNSLHLVVKVPDEPLLVSADSVRLAQSLGNLLHNAAKFTPAGGQVALIVESGSGADSARISVCDTGAGIEPDLLPHIFEPFVQGDGSLAHTQGGLGLGLAVVKGLVELHGGSVRAASDGPNLGATFTIELPLDSGNSEILPTPFLSPARVPRVGRRVLLIEDNLDAADSLRAVLESLGHVVETANDGGAGIALARAFQPEIVFCDIGLPVMDGYAVARALREDARLPGVVLVAMTGYAQPDARRRSAEAGFHDHLAKPPSLDRLEEVLARATLPLA
jgi:two-component system CheB/CheR fusion protein